MTELARPPAFEDVGVKRVFDAYPHAVAGELLFLRQLIFEAADETAGVGPLSETLKWGQPAYVPRKPHTGSPIRIDALKNEPGGYALLVHCRTTLIDTFAQIYGDRFVYQGNRALLFSSAQTIDESALKHCIDLGLTYHARRRSQT
jgi:hypothetical protein